MSIKKIQERHDRDTKHGIEVFSFGCSSDVLSESLEEANRELEIIHKDRGELLDALREIGELVDTWNTEVVVEQSARYDANIEQSVYNYCACGIQAILDKL